jgi:predicted transcriptional regulator
MTFGVNPSKVVLMSIKTKFVKSIIDGSKTYELRRKIPRDVAGMKIFIYSSGVERAITVHADVSKVATGTPEEIWKKHSALLGITYSEFSDYFAGAEVAYALELSNVTRSRRPVTLEQLRNDFGLEPPQSWRYLTSDSYEKLLKHAVCPES